ncbi:MAG: hypothetical protein J6D07_02915 [Mogibacterium sp.]|nr:hypothetical protein [Mogibacterium sp.]
MKVLLELVLFLIVASLAIWLLPLAIGVLVAVTKFQSGKILGGVISVIIGLLCEVVWLWIFCSGKVPIGDGEGEDCPYCGSGDTDGNHCYTCEEDF